MVNAVRKEFTRGRYIKLCGILIIQAVISLIVISFFCRKFSSRE